MAGFAPPGKEKYALPMRSTVSSKGQVTVPTEVREQLGLAPGTPVEFELREEGVLPISQELGA